MRVVLLIGIYFPNVHVCITVLFIQCVLVQGYPASSSWGFPKGKMDEGEKDSDAAVREVILSIDKATPTAPFIIDICIFYRCMKR